MKETRDVARLQQLLTELTGEDVQSHETPVSLEGEQLDAVLLTSPSRRYIAALESTGTVPAVSAALSKVRRAADLGLPLIVVPYMGKHGADLCRQAEVSWLDLSGNAYIRDEPLLVNVQGRPNRFKRRGRPPNVFSPRSSRVTRYLLSDPSLSHTQREIAQATDMNQAMVSIVVRELERQRLVERDTRTRAVRPGDPDMLLRAWEEVYDFFRHHVIRGHVAARSSEASLHELSKTLRSVDVDHAATGLAAAWLLSPFVAFRTVTLYVRSDPDTNIRRAMGFRETERGANTWLVVPDDAGVFQGRSERSGIPCVHPVQAYLDLSGHPERAEEAAKRIREVYLRWRDGNQERNPDTHRPRSN